MNLYVVIMEQRVEARRPLYGAGERRDELRLAAQPVTAALGAGERGVDELAGLDGGVAAGEDQGDAIELRAL